MKKLVSILMVAVLVLSISACGSDNSETKTDTNETANETSAPETVEKEKLKIGVSLPSPANQFVGAIIEAAEREAAKDTDNYDITVVVSDSPGAQVGAIEDLTQEKLDVLVVLPLESAPLTPICDQVFSEGTKIVILDRGILSGSYTTFIAGDNYGIGVSAANYIGEQLNGQGKIVEIMGVPCEIVTQRSDGFADTIAEKYPGIEVIAQATGDFSREPSLKAMEDILQAFDTIDAVYSHDDEQSLGIQIAVQNAGRESEMFLTGAGGNKAVFEGMMAGEGIIDASFIYSPTMGGTAVAVAKAIASGTGLEAASKDDPWLDMSLIDMLGEDYLEQLNGSVPEVITLSASTVTAENAEEFYNPDSSY